MSSNDRPGANERCADSLGMSRDTVAPTSENNVHEITVQEENFIGHEVRELYNPPLPPAVHMTISWEDDTEVLQHPQPQTKASMQSIEASNISNEAGSTALGTHEPGRVQDAPPPYAAALPATQQIDRGNDANMTRSAQNTQPPGSHARATVIQRDETVNIVSILSAFHNTCVGAIRNDIAARDGVAQGQATLSRGARHDIACHDGALVHAARGFAMFSDEAAQIYAIALTDFTFGVIDVLHLRLAVETLLHVQIAAEVLAEQRVQKT